MPKSNQFTARFIQRFHHPGRYLPIWASLAAFLVAGAQSCLVAQEAGASAPSASAHKVINHRKHPAASKLVESQPAPPVPPAPVDPHWPANDKANQASITWDSRGLRIEASNSSLQQILKDVATVTGAKVEGLTADERVFGAYGPGLARDVLSQLLQGSSYNVLMIGDQGQGAPRQIVLSSRNGGSMPSNTTPAASDQNNGDDDNSDVDQDDQNQAPQSPPIRPNFGPGNPPRTPQQMLQEMQQRQQEMLRQQQQNQQNQPH